MIAFFLPESPRFLVLKKRDDDVRAIFARIWPDDDVERAIRDVRHAIKTDEEGSKKGALRARSFRLQTDRLDRHHPADNAAVCGNRHIFYYSTTLWKSVGFQEKDSFTISVITAVTNIVVTFVAIALVDRVGRRPIPLFGSAGMTPSLALMAVAISQADVVKGAPSLPGRGGRLRSSPAMCSW